MATLCYFPSCSSISSLKLFCTHRHHLICRPIFKHFTIHDSATSNSKRNGKIKSNDELCNDIRGFFAALGLPEDYVPSTKELLQHGRKDLANIVRRRGHKLIRVLLASSLDDNSNDVNTDESLDDKVDDSEYRTGENVEMDSTDDDVVIASSIICQVDNSSDSDTVLNINSAQSSLEVNNISEENRDQAETSLVDDGSSRPREGPSASFDDQTRISAANEPNFDEISSGNSVCEDKMTDKVVEDLTLSPDVPEKENQSSNSYSDSDLKTEDTEFKPLESAGLSLTQKDLSELEGQDESNDNIAENVQVCLIINRDSSANPSLGEKAAKIIQRGDLDLVEADFSGIPKGNNSEESKVYTESEYVVEMPLRTNSAGHSTQPPKDDTALELNGKLLTSKGDHMPAEGVTSHFDADLDEKATKMKNQSEIVHLKFMLHQKELQLSWLKEQIEKERLALSLLQTKAETELSKARKHISEEVAELRVAEESLPGLKEVQIQFCGDADVVEVTGSFNGWHHRIKMDPQPSTKVEVSAGSRRSRLWSTVLWLYPGLYEIKFIVDGHWKIDPQRETVTRGHICNNIIRVNK